MNPWRRFRSRLRSQTLVLCYHRVASPPSDRFNCCVTPQHFREQMDVLRERYCVPAYQRLIDLYAPSRLPGRRAVIITFDDGYADNLHVASRVLQDFGFHAIFYIFTGWIENAREAWWDRLESSLFEGPLPPAPLRLRGIDAEIPVGSPAELLAALYEPLRNAPDSDRERALADLQSPAKTSTARPGCRPLSRTELQELAKQPGTHIGAHTVSHPFLPRLPLTEQRLEIARSREWLEGELGLPVTDLAYPYGGFSAETRAAASAAGMQTGVTCESRTTRRSDEPLAIPRATVHDWDGDEFARRLEWWFSN